MLRQDILRSANPAAACDAFLDSLHAWVDACIARHADKPLYPGHAGHDQLTYTTPWATLIKHRGHDDALAFMKRQRDRVRDHMNQTGFWHHGYWKQQEAHHGTEHYELFLGTLLNLAPNDEATRQQLIDAAEHFGNWVEGIPAFFDWDAGLFRSVNLGTEVVGQDPAEAINTPDHLRLVNIALIAFEHTREPRYLNLADAHGRRWAQAITQNNALPLALLPDGPVYDFTEAQAEAYAKVAGAASIVQAREIAPIDRAENLLASNAIEALLTLWQHTGRDTYRAAVERLMDVIISQINDPDAGALSAVIRHYRNATHDTRYDAAVLDATQRASGITATELMLDTDHRHGSAGGGIGKRADMPRWLINQNQPRHISPMLLALAGEISSDESLITRAVDLAHAHFQLATRAFRSGNHHGCCATSVSAVARGHGRDNNAGMVTAVLEPVLQRR